jgi:diguanylate cyclase (GGDEF)-like protein
MVALRRDIAHGEPLALKLGNIEAQCHFLAARAAVERNAARYAESYALFDQAIALAQQPEMDRMRAALQLDKAMTAIENGRQSDAIGLLVTAHALFEARNERLGAALALDSMGTATSMALTNPADAARAIRYHEQALELLDPAVNRSAAITVYYNIGIALSRAGDQVQARRYIQRGLEMTDRYQGPVGAAYFSYTLAKIAHREKHYAETLGHLDRALPGFKLRGDLPLMVFYVLTTRADVLSSMGRYAESLQSLAEARVPLAELNSPSRDAVYHQLAATVHERAGRYEEAYAALKQYGLAEQRSIQAVNGKLTAELQTRFDVQRKDSENALLRLQQKESGARRMVLVLGLLLSLVILGVLVAYLIQQMRRSRRFAALALRDELTGLPNRRSITEFARLQWAARSGQEGKLRVAILDIDHFKHVNDEFGHSVGDAVLKAFAQACDGKLRRTERLGRYGGEEFLLIMPASEAAHVAIVFRRLQEAVQNMQVPGLPVDRRLSFSMGAAEAWDSGDNLDAMIQRADEALYAAKRNGRDRFEIATHLRLASIETRPAAVLPLRASGA